MKELTLEELAELEQMLAVVPRSLADAVAFRDACYLQSPALLAMARELIRLRGALNYLDDAGATVIMKGRPQLRFATRPASVLFIAHDLGLVDPLSTPAAPVAEGGEG